MTTNAWGTAPAAGASSSWADDEVDEPEVASFSSSRQQQAANNDFPTLGEAAKQQPAAAKKKAKGQKLALGQFLTAGGAAPTRFIAPSAARSSDADILSQLPTAPRADRDGEEGGGMGGFGRGDFGGGGFGGRGGFSRDDGRPDRREGFEPSRADTIDDWGTTKKFTPSEGGRGGFGERRTGGGGFGDRYGSDRPPMGMGPPRDEGDGDWGSNKKFEPSAAGPRSGPSGAGGFRDAPRRGFDSAEGPPRGDDEDQWSRGRAFQPSAPDSRGPPGGRAGFGFGGSSAADEDRWARRAAPAEDSQQAPSNGAPAERPRLKLQPRTVPVDTPVPAPANTSSTAAEPAKPKSNPFGAARPREEVLKEKGVDPLKEDLKLPAVDRDTTPEEKALSDQVEQLRKKLELLKASAPDPESIADEVASADEELSAKEKELANLKNELDDKVRFAKKSPGRDKSDSGAGSGSFADAAADTREPRGAARSRGPPEPRSTSREAGSFAGAPGRERW